MEHKSKRLQYLTEAEVSELTRIALPTLRNQRFRCVGIPYSKIGRSVRNLLQDVSDYMSERRIDTVQTGK